MNELTVLVFISMAMASVITMANAPVESRRKVDLLQWRKVDDEFMAAASEDINDALLLHFHTLRDVVAGLGPSVALSFLAKMCIDCPGSLVNCLA